ATYPFAPLPSTDSPTTPPARRTSIQPPRDSLGRFSARQATQLLPPTPPSIADTPSHRNSESSLTSSPSLSDLLDLEPATPYRVAPELPTLEDRVPFPPSPVTPAPDRSEDAPEQVTPTSTRRVRVYSAPNVPAPSLLARFSATHVPAAPIPPLATPVSVMAKNEDLRAARVMLAKLGDFDDDGKPMAEAMWRHKFSIATQDLDDTQRAKLWGDHLLYDGVAFNWLGALKGSTLGATQAADWSQLAPLVEGRWPTPKKDPEAYAEQQRREWDASILRVADMIPVLADETSALKPHDTWAKQHLVKGRACGSTNADLVYRTVNQALPRWVVNLLPKKSRYGAAFEELCEDIGKITSRDLLDAFIYEHNYQLLVSSVGGLAIAPPQLPSTVYSTAAPAPAPAPLPTATQTRVPNTPSFVRVQPTPAGATAVPMPSAPSTPSQPRVRQTPPHIPQQPTPHTPTHLPAQVPRVVQTTPVLQAPPASGDGYPLRDALPTVLEDSPATRSDHELQVEQYRQTYRTKPPGIERPYPLTPGTYAQTRDVCVRCGRGFHFAAECDAASHLILPDRETSMRKAILKSMKPVWVTSRGRGGAGAMQGTPTPPTRPGGGQPRDVAQLEVQDSIPSWTDQLSESENEEGQ
ncbi:hypothetical protein FRC10_002245, partial [Ceratobasidium sp. 414]